MISLKNFFLNQNIINIVSIRYKFPIEMILSLLTILGVRKFIKNNL